MRDVKGEEEDMGQVRAWFLASQRSPRVILKDAGSMKTLMYTCTARDQAKGVVTIHCAPPEFEAIKLWLAELDLGLKYTGSGLPAISAQVLADASFDVGPSEQDARAKIFVGFYNNILVVVL